MRQDRWPAIQFQGLFSDITRIDEVRKALAEVLPSATKFRKIGLITYGPGPYAHCNVELDFAPIPNATERIMSVVNAINPAGKTPLVEAVKRAAEVLAYQGTIVLLTDGEETCGGAPCELGKSIKATATGQLTVHVVGYQLRGYSWTGAESILDVKCLAEETGGLYITAENQDDLVKAFEKTLGCPMMSAHRRSVALSASFGAACFIVSPPRSRELCVKERKRGQSEACPPSSAVGNDKSLPTSSGSP